MAEPMRLTNFTDYGLRSLIYLAIHAERRCSAREISAYYSISYNHIVKVVHQLSLSGLVVTSRGKGGGIMLAKGTLDRPVGDIVSQLEPDFHLVECFDEKSNGCRITEICGLRHHLVDARSAFIAKLNDKTLRDILPADPAAFKALAPKAE
ncbi:RrF2 family transcriptional regulator [Paracoccaceae bacterium GXU_MW_L88]